MQPTAERARRRAGTRELITFPKGEAAAKGLDLTSYVNRMLEGVRTWFGLPDAAARDVLTPALGGNLGNGWERLAVTDIDQGWWKTFFDADYLHVWSRQVSSSRTDAEVEFLCRALQLRPECRVLDAPCGYGRVSLPLAQRGMVVLGVDYSRTLLEEAERRRGAVPPERLGYLQHDLREPLRETGFDAAVNLFTSLGYGTEEDDRRILTTLQRALRPGGRILVETIHRDSLAALVSRDEPFTYELGDGTVARQFPRLDPLSRRAEITYRWDGPSGSGEKVASVLIYSVSELVELLASAGFEDVRVSQGDMGAHEAKPIVAGHVAVVAKRAGA